MLVALNINNFVPFPNCIKFYVLLPQLLPTGKQTPSSPYLGHKGDDDVGNVGNRNLKLDKHFKLTTSIFLVSMSFKMAIECY